MVLLGESVFGDELAEVVAEVVEGCWCHFFCSFSFFVPQKVRFLVMAKLKLTFFAHLTYENVVLFLVRRVLLRRVR